MRNGKGRFIKGNVIPHKGGCTCFRCSGLAWNKGKHTGNYGNGFKKGHHLNKGRKPFLGKKHTGESKLKMRGLHAGKKNGNWKGGITPINKLIRKSVEYKLWRKAVFERDNYTCIFCGERGGELHPDHIKPFALFPELRFAIDNGRTLCKSCHMKTDTWGYRASNYKG